MPTLRDPAGMTHQALGLIIAVHAHQQPSAYGGRSLKAQWKAADRCGARYGVMIGKAELERESVAVKDLETGEQIEVRRDQLVSWLQESFEENYE